MQTANLAPVAAAGAGGVPRSPAVAADEAVTIPVVVGWEGAQGGAAALVPRHRRRHQSAAGCWSAQQWECSHHVSGRPSPCGCHPSLTSSCPQQLARGDIKRQLQIPIFSYTPSPTRPQPVLPLPPPPPPMPHLPYFFPALPSKCALIHPVVTLLGRSMGSPKARSHTRLASVPMARLTPNMTV